MSEAFQEAMEDGVISQEPHQYSKVHIKDFEKSGLLIKTVRKAGYESIPERVVDDELDSRGRKKKRKVPGYWQVPITNPFTKELYYYRKKLDEPIKDKNDKEIRYLTPSNCEPHLYFSLQIDDWKNILPNPSIPIILTEGEKKADKAIQEGFIAVAVSGVWCWSSNHEPIPDLKHICIKGRLIPIIFDSDYKDKPQVQKAIEKLMEAIKSLGAIPVDCSLPGPEKGLDDFLVARSKEALKKHIEDCIKTYEAECEEEKHYLVEAIKYLSGDVIRNNFLPLTNKLGLIGEESLKVISYLCGISRLTDELNGALHPRVIGDSGMGKSKVMEFIGENFIGNDFMERASLTVASIYRRGPKYFKHKVLFQSELLPAGESQEEINGLFRTLKTKGKADRDVTTKRGKDIVSITLTVEGPTSQWGTTTRSDGRDEDLNRDIIVSPDNSREQTYRIQQSKMGHKKKYNSWSHNALKHNLEVQNQVQEFLKDHIPAFVEIPYSEYIKLPIKGGAARRDPDKITRLIESCCQTNILNRAFKLLDCADKVDELVGLVSDFSSNPLHQMLNDESVSNSNESQRIDDLMKSTSEVLKARYLLYLNLQKIDLNSKEYLKAENVIIKKQDHDILIFISDPQIGYLVLKEFVKKNDLGFVLISDTRDFETVKEYCAEAIESPYQKLSKTYQAAYRKILDALPDLPRNKAGGEVGYHCTVAEVEDILECTNHWAWDVLKKLVNEGYCSVEEKKKPYVYNFTKSKLAESFNKKEEDKHFYKLELKPFSISWNATSSNIYNAKLEANSKENQEISSDEAPASEVIQKKRDNYIKSHDTRKISPEFLKRLNEVKSAQN